MWWIASCINQKEGHISTNQQLEYMLKGNGHALATRLNNSFEGVRNDGSVLRA